MAHKSLVYSMISERNTASGTLESVSAGTAADKLICAAPVQKQNALLAAFNVGPDLITEKRANVAIVSTPQLSFHIDNFDLRQMHFIVSLIESEITVSANNVKIPPEELCSRISSFLFFAA